MVSRRPRHVPAGAHREVPNAHPVLNETNVTDAGLKTGPAELGVKEDASAGGLVEARAPATTAEHAAVDSNRSFLAIRDRAGHDGTTAPTAPKSLGPLSGDFLIPVRTPTGPDWFLWSLSRKYVLPIFSNISIYRYSTGFHVRHRAQG